MLLGSGIHNVSLLLQKTLQKYTLSESSQVLYFICGIEILGELSGLQIQLHTHPTCRPLRLRMQHLDLPTNRGYRITGDHKIFRSDLEANGSVIEGYDSKR